MQITLKGQHAKSGKPHYKMTFGGNKSYEGATNSYRMGNKGIVAGDPNRHISHNLRRLRERSRHAVRNHPYASSAIEKYVANLIGSGIVAKWKHPKLQKLWQQSVAEIDIDGHDNFYGLQALAAREQFEAGEVLARFLTAPRSLTNGTVPFRLQLIESDHLDEKYSIGNKIRWGIEFDESGRRKAYHLWQHHPQGQQLGNKRLKIPFKNLLHLFRRTRAGQWRGIPELSVILLRLYDIDEMQDAMLVRQKAAALLGWIVTKREKDGDPPPIGVPVGQVGGDNSVVVDNPASDAPSVQKVTPGGIHYFDEDEELTFAEPPDIGGSYVPWLKSNLRAVASGIGLTYEQLTGDLEGVNFSSIRAGLLEFRRRIEMLQYQMMVHQFCYPIAKQWLKIAIASGVVSEPEVIANPSKFLPAWRAPRWDWVDPLKDVMADMLEVRAGFDTRKNKNSERGFDYEEIDDQLVIEQASKLVLDTNPAKVTKQGQMQQEGDLINGDNQ